MVGWHHWHDGYEFEWAPGVGDRQGSLVCYSPWGRKESDVTEGLNWTNELPLRKIKYKDKAIWKLVWAKNQGSPKSLGRVIKCVCVCVCERSVAQSCLTLYDLMDCTPPGSSVHRILPARILELVAISFSRDVMINRTLFSSQKCPD